jgi:hypothetical protein
LSMSRLGGAGAVAQLVADIPLPVKVIVCRKSSAHIAHASCHNYSHILPIYFHI